MKTDSQETRGDILGESTKSIEKLVHWLFIKITIKNFYFILGSLYFNLIFEVGVLLEMLQIVIDDLNCNYVNLLILIGGDFNARLGALADFDQLPMSNSELMCKIYSCDITVNKRAMELINFMGINGFVILSQALSTPCQFGGQNSKNAEPQPESWAL